MDHKMKIDITYEKPWYSAHIKKLCISTQTKNPEQLVSNIQETIELYYKKERDHRRKQENMKFYLDMNMFKYATNLQRA